MERRNLRESRQRRPADHSVKENVAPTQQKSNREAFNKRLEEWKKKKEEKKLEQQRMNRLRPVFKVTRAREDDAVLKSKFQEPATKRKAVETNKVESGPKRSKVITSRTDSGLKSLKLSTVVNINFAETSSKPMIFTGAEKKTTAKDDQEKRRSISKAVKTFNKMRPQRPPASSIAEKLWTVNMDRPKPQHPQLQQIREEAAREERLKSPAGKKADTPRPAHPPHSSRGDAAKERTPHVSSDFAERSSRKRPAEALEDCDGDSHASLGCTPSGKVRRVKSGTPVPVIRKSFELRRLKTTEERVEALRNSPMIEFRKKGHGAVAAAVGDGRSPLVLDEEEAEKRVRIMEKVSEDYSKSPLGTLPARLPELDAASARKLRRKSRQLEQQLTSASASTGTGVAVLTAQHFRGLLLDETSRLSELRGTWEALSADASVPDHVQAEIATVLGQTELLFRHKFFFYESMIAQHEEGDSSSRAGSALDGRLVTVEDLMGYWDLIGIEIGNIDARYQRLEKWRQAGWRGDLHEVDKAKRRQPARPARAKAAPKKAAGKSKFAEFRSQMLQRKKEEEKAAALLTDDSDDAAAPPPAVTPGRSAAKSVRFAEDVSGEATPPASQRRRPLTPYRARVSRRSNPSFGGEFAEPAPQVTRPTRGRSNSSRSSKDGSMPSSPRTPPPQSPNSILDRPKTGTPFPASPQRSGSRRRIADVVSSAGLTLRTGEAARRKSKSCSPPASSGRARQSGVRFVEGSSPYPDAENPPMPVTPYNQSSLVPMPRRSRASNSAPRQTRKTEERCSSGSRVRFDSSAVSPPPAVDSAPVTPYNKTSLVPLPRRSRKSAMEQDDGPAGEVFVQSITPPLTPRLIDITPVRRSGRLRAARREDE